MKKFLSLLLISVVSVSLKAQVDSLFYEDFNTPNWKLTTSWTPPANYVVFEHDTFIHKGPSGGSATDTVGNRTTSHLTSPKFSIRDAQGQVYANFRLEFDQICYIDTTNEAWVEYKLGDSTWNKFPDFVTLANVPNVRVYLGPSDYLGPTDSINPTGSNYHYFNKYSGPTNLWQHLDTAFVFTPTYAQSRWFHETFDIGALIAWETIENNFPINQVDSMQIRFSLHDHPASLIGRRGTHRWWIDNVAVLKGLVVGIDEIEKQKLSIYPNPADEFIRLDGLGLKTTDYIVYDLTGKSLLQGRLGQNHEIGIGDLPDGLYFLQIGLDQEAKVLKFIKK